MYERIDACPICTSVQLKNHLICQDHFHTKESFALQHCQHCDHVFTNPRPTPEVIHRYYQTPTYLSHHSDKSIKGTIYSFIRFLNARRKYHLIQDHVSKGKLLDYGCGNGHFLSLAPASYQRFGYEPIAEPLNKQHIQYLQDEQDIEAHKKFDIITLWHVLEHVPDPHHTIKLLRNVLKKDGYLFIALPNRKSYDAEHYQTHWAGYDVPRHLHHFSQDSFRALLKAEKLKLVAQKPLYFDSYYVSQLSQTYQDKPSLLQAIITATKSNYIATKTGQYSSIIYIIRK